MSIIHSFSMLTLLAIFKYLVLFYIILLVTLYFGQDNLLYFPQKTGYVPNVFIKIKEGDNVLGYYYLEHPDDFKKAVSKSNKFIVVFHGNSGTALGREYYKKLTSPDEILILAEYPGFGENFQTPINKDTVYDQSSLLIEHLQKAYPDKKITAVGESLGTGPASYVAAKYHLDKVLLITPYDQIANIAQYKYPFVPAKYLLKDKYDNVANLNEYKGSVFLMACKKDEVVPFQFAENLSNTVKNASQKTFLLLQECGHNDWMNLLSNETTQQLKDFLNK